MRLELSLALLDILYSEGLPAVFRSLHAAYLQGVKHMSSQPSVQIIHRCASDTYNNNKGNSRTTRVKEVVYKLKEIVTGVRAGKSHLCIAQPHRRLNCFPPSKEKKT